MDRASSGRSRPSRMLSRRRASRAGFSLIELLVAVVVIGIVSAIAVPNLLRAMKKARRTAAYTSVYQIEDGIQEYMLHNDNVPYTLNIYTLEPLVSEGALTPQQAQGILSSLEDNQLYWYWGWSGPWWGYDYSIGFRPKGEGLYSYCYLYPDFGWCWYDGEGWEEIRHW